MGWIRERCSKGAILHHDYNSVGSMNVHVTKLHKNAYTRVHVKLAKSVNVSVWL
jgi:hypothetical protein